MFKITRDQIKKIPLVKPAIALLQNITFETLQGVSLYELIKHYFIGIVRGAFTYRASAIAFSFFMALFPFALFVLNLIPFIPLEHFQEDFLEFVSQSVPPNTFEAIASILKDIMNTSYKGLLSSGFFLSIFLMSNGINALLDGFEMSSNISVKRGFFQQYAVAIGLSICVAFLLLLSVATLIVVEIILYNIQVQNYFSSDISVLKWSRFVFIVLMVLLITSLLYKFGTKETRKIPFFSYGSTITTVLFLLTSYVFGIYVEKFARYNELYGSIGTLLVMMFYVWINCMLLLLGFELNAFIFKWKQKNK
ncbi:YihY/virulence factor BrkB family protein [Flavobacterium sp. 20NA77.7]|uniref:YihY/virulence factor BrkB family protein n=1 Tax=Flavobacterium nakdongensis TaxID=3073563 RepID=A0ABY9R8W0_9FLAO|nr:YihY/virulence factor BrkB family protein [Flavobacterium sp. 20NA77.7]WMW77278.1 YihY/virulence factor BrkB family protein [Flavobacterium sp. 20NA77.7]